MRNLGRLFIAIIVLAFAINEANAQRRSNNNNRDNNNRRERVRVTQQIRPTRVIRQRVIRQRPVRRGFGTYYNNRFVYRGFGIYNRPGFGIYSLPQQRTLESVQAQEEALENALELVRARKLYKYLNRPNKRNKRKLVKYNILTGRDANDITS